MGVLKSNDFRGVKIYKFIIGNCIKNKRPLISLRGLLGGLLNQNRLFYNVEFALSNYSVFFICNAVNIGAVSKFGNVYYVVVSF
jgi:hypothetical protein